MKRIATPALYEHLWRIRPWFSWRLCEMCRQEFRREIGWAAFVGPWFGGRGRRIYLCQQCAPTESRASQIAAGRLWMKPPNVRPPAPPPRKLAG